MSLVLVPPTIIQAAIRAIYPVIPTSGRDVLRKLLELCVQAVLNEVNDAIVSIARSLLEGSIYADPSVLESHADQEGNRWTHVFTAKSGHLNPNNSVVKAVLALIFKIIPIIGQEVSILNRTEQLFKKRFELGFTASNLLFWVRMALNKDTGKYYIESAGADKLQNLLNNGGELLTSLK